MGFAETALRLQPFGIDKTLDDDLGLGRHDEVDGLGLAHADRRADEAARDRQFIELLRQLVHGREHDGRRRAEQQYGRHPLAAGLVFEPVLVNALVEFDLRVHAQPGRAFDHGPVVADVLPPGVRVLGDEHRARGIGRVVEARRRDRDRQPIDALAVLVQGVADGHDLLARGVVDKLRLELMLLGEIPLLLDVLDLAADAEAVDLAVGGEDADRDRNVVALPLGVGDVLEQKPLALRLRNAAAELPAHQRVHLGVLVDRPLHPHQMAVPLQRRDMRVQVGVGEVRAGDVGAFEFGVREIVHVIPWVAGA